MMDALRDRVDTLIRSRRLPWKRQGDTVEVELWKRGRRQRVHLDLQGGHYVLWSVVVGTAYVTQSDDHWRALAYRAWRKNALKDLIAFSFDDQDRLVGRIEQPASTLDEDELELYIRTVAEECDRFEYNLTGEDWA